MAVRVPEPRGPRRQPGVGHRSDRWRHARAPRSRVRHRGARLEPVRLRCVDLRAGPGRGRWCGHGVGAPASPPEGVGVRRRRLRGGCVAAHRGVDAVARARGRVCLRPRHVRGNGVRVGLHPVAPARRGRTARPDLLGALHDGAPVRAHLLRRGSLPRRVARGPVPPSVRGWLRPVRGGGGRRPRRAPDPVGRGVDHRRGRVHRRLVDAGCRREELVERRPALGMSGSESVAP